MINYRDYAPIFNFLIFIVIFGLIFFFFKTFEVIAFPLLLSLFFTYLMDPPVTYFEKKYGLSRTLLSLLAVLFIVVVIAIGLLILIPELVYQTTIFAKKIPQVTSWIVNKLQSFSDFLYRTFPFINTPINVEEAIKKEFPTLFNGFSSIIPDFFTNIYNLILSILYMILVPIFTFYLLKELPNIKKTLLDFVPPRMRETVREKSSETNRVISAFLRGQLTVSLILMVLFSIGLSIIGLPFAVLIGVFSGLGDMIPYFGTLVGVFISLIIALLGLQSLKSAFLVLAVYGVIKAVENWFIYPKLVGSYVGLHPLIIILAVIFAGEYFGIIGMFLTIPFLGVLKVFLKDIAKWYFESKLYKGEKNG